VSGRLCLTLHPPFLALLCVLCSIFLSFARAIEGFHKDLFMDGVG
jgi:hypothetical protein